KKAPSLGSPVTAVIRLPNSVIKVTAFALSGPRVSRAIGMNMYDRARSAYLVSFLSPALSAALPAFLEVEGRWDAANVSATVTSHVRFLPPCQGINVRPSGRFPSALIRPTGSLVEGRPARDKDRHIKSLMC